jgi:hypothetical protein
MKTLAKIETVLKIAIIHDGKSYVAVAPALKVYGTGKTENSAVKDLNKSLLMFVKIHEKKNNLLEKLISLGWRRTDHTIMPPMNLHLPVDNLSKGTMVGFRDMPMKTPQYATC